MYINKNSIDVTLFSRRSFGDLLKFMAFFIPGGKHIMHAAKIPISKKEETEFFITVIETTLQHRQQSGTKRNDLIDMMMEAMKNPDSVREEDLTDQYEKDAKLDHKNKKELDDMTIVATAMVMLVAGYDTTAQTLSFIAYELTMQEDIQRRLQVRNLCKY